MGPYKRATACGLIVTAGVWFFFAAWVVANFGPCVSSGGRDLFLTCLGTSRVAPGVAVLSVLIMILGFAFLFRRTAPIYPILCWAVITASGTMYLLLIYGVLLANFIPAAPSDLSFGLSFLPPVLLAITGSLLGWGWSRQSRTLTPAPRVGISSP